MNMSVSIQDTQWRSFRSMTRNRPLKQARILATVLSLSFLYVYLLFTPHLSQKYVMELNAKESSNYYTQWHEHSIKLQERRNEWAQKQHEARVRRNQVVRNATILKERHMNTTHYTRDEAQQQQQHVVHRMLGMIISLVASMCMCASAQFLHRLFHGNDSTTTTTTPSRSQTRRQARENRFREWARQLNRQRVQQGERPLSLTSLRLVVRGRDISTAGNDYEALLRMEEEAGPAMHALLQSMGATSDEIQRCPQRILTEKDDLLQATANKEPPHCPVCLEVYQVGNQVRTIPCFHTFHTECIDPWLTQKAVCPVCKHPAVA